MQKYQRAARALLAFALVLSVSACAATYRNSGYVPTRAELAEIQVGVDDRASVTEKIGTPTSAGVVGQSAWYYVGSRREFFAYRAPRIIDRQIVAISFDGADRVRNIERFTLEDGRVVPLSRRVTDSNIQDVTFLRQLFGSLGNIDLGQFTN